MSLLSHPMRVLPSGNFATAEDGSDRYIAERIGLVLTVRRGERREVPDYGIGDLEFEGLTHAALENQIEQFGPPAIITDVIVLSDHFRIAALGKEPTE